MKKTNSFAEVAEIFATIAKVERIVNEYDKTYAEYRELSSQFNGVYAEQKELADAMIAKFDIVEKLDKKFHKGVAKVIALMGVDRSNYEEGPLFEYANAYSGDKWVYNAKYLAQKMVFKMKIDNYSMNI